jgi:hypothetical protein
MNGGTEKEQRIKEVSRYMNGWMVPLKKGWMDGWMNRWMD